MSLMDLLALARRRWTVLAGCVVVCVGLAIGYGLTATRQYRVESILTTPSSVISGGADQLMSRFGGIASLVGLPGGDSQGRTQEAVAILRSRAFLREIVERRNLLPLLFEEDWDASQRAWRIDREHTTDDGAKALERLFTVSLDRATGFVALVFTWRDRGQATEWSKLLIKDLNEKMRIAAQEEATQSLSFLEDELTSTSALEVQTAVYGLMESQIKTRMLTNVTESYALQFLAPPVEPQAKDFVWPKMPALGLLGITAGLTLGLSLARLIDRRSARFVES